MPYKTYSTKADYDSEYDVGAEDLWPRPTSRPEIRLRYSRLVLMPYVRQRAVGIANAMGWTAPGPILVIVGAGFSWLTEAFETELGFTSIVGVDVSPYIQSAKDQPASDDLDDAILAVGLNPATGEGLARKNLILSTYDPGGGNRTRSSRTVLAEDGKTNQSRNRIRQALGLSGNAQPDWLLSENVIERMTDAEIVADSASLRAWVPQVAHYVQPRDARHLPGPDANGHDWNAKTAEEWKLLLPNDTIIEAETFRRL